MPLAVAKVSPVRLVDAEDALRPGETGHRARLAVDEGYEEVLLAATPGHARLADLVPPARDLADRVMRRLMEHAAAAGLHVPCRRGCFACCRYIVPVSAPEAMALADAIDSLPAPQRAAQEARFHAAARAVLSAFPRLDGSSTVADLSDWHWSLGLDCPLLNKGKCAAYAERPLSCREHYVTGSPAACREKGSDQRAGLLPISLAEALCAASAAIEGTGPQSVLLPLSLEWARSETRRRHRTYPAADVAEALARAISRARAIAA
jgi:Fe-S-cluster containining protein